MARRRLTRAHRLGAAAAAAAILGGALAPAALAVTPEQGRYTGRTDQTDVPANGVRLRVDRHHDVARFAIDWSAKCNRPNTFWDAGTQISDPKNGPTGTFHEHGKYRSKTQNGFVGRVTLTVDGHFTDSTHAQGQWNATVKVYNPKGRRVYTCTVATGWRAGPAGG